MKLVTDFENALEYASLMSKHLLRLDEGISLDERAKHAEIALAASSALRAEIYFTEFVISVKQLTETGENTILFKTSDITEAERMAKSPEFKELYAQYLEEKAAKEG